MISSIISHVFGDMIDSAKRNETIVVDTKSITDFLAAEPSVVKTALQTPLLQDILSDISFVRQLLLSNSTIAELIVSNPGLKEFIDRDDKLRELTSAISDTTNFCDFKHLQQMIVQKVEHSIGNQLQFDQSSVFICVSPYPESQNAAPPPSEGNRALLRSSRRAVFSQGRTALSYHSAEFVERKAREESRLSRW